MLEPDVGISGHKLIHSAAKCPLKSGDLGTNWTHLKAAIEYLLGGGGGGDGLLLERTGLKLLLLEAAAA